MIPNLFRKEPIPHTLPASMASKIMELQKSSTKEEFLEKSFYLISSKNRGNRFNLIFKLPELFITDIDYLWSHEGFFYCTSLNYLLRIMLVKSKCFRDEDIKLKLTSSYFVCPHQYLSIRLDQTREINADIFAYAFGVRFGDYGHGFHFGSFFPK